MSLVMEGLREEYRSTFSFLRVIGSRFTGIKTDSLILLILILQSKLIQICNLLDMRQKGIAAADATSAHFGSVHDAFDYQHPPASVRPRNPAPAETSNLQNVIDGFKAHHSVNNSIGDKAIRAVEHALMGATTDNRVCYFCGQHGHIAANCPRKRQHRPQQNPSVRFPNPYQP